jgi:hypothetical protein
VPVIKVSASAAAANLIFVSLADVMSE